MAYAVSLLLDASTGALVSERWQQLADAGLSRSMLDLGYPPHVTLAVYDDLDVNTATTALDGTLTTAPRIDVKLSGITSFGAGSGVVYAALAPSSDLSVLHETVLGTIGGHIIRSASGRRTVRWPLVCRMLMSIGLSRC